MYIATERPVQVKAENVFPIAKKDLIGTVTSDTEADVKLRGKEDTVKINLKNKIIVDEKAFARKGYTEIIVDDKKIMIGVEGTTVIAMKNMAGYYCIHKEDLIPLIDAAKELAKIKKNGN